MVTMLPYPTPITCAEKSAEKEILAMKRNKKTGRHGEVFDGVFNDSFSVWVLLRPKLSGYDRVACQLTY
jgi:hypothetical protein